MTANRERTAASVRLGTAANELQANSKGSPSLGNAAPISEKLPLIFETPSKSCGARAFNGQKVWLTDRRYRKKVRRIGSYANVFLVYCPDVDEWWWALADELFYDREECL